MKKIITILAILLTVNALAQVPQKMSYQAIIRNNSNQLLTSTTVGMQISILQGSAIGTSVYTETQTPVTNVNGLVTVEIGSGTVVTGVFSSINWATGVYFIKTEIDPSGGTAYSITGATQLISVPYALYANTSGNIGATGPAGPTGPTGPAGSIQAAQFVQLGVQPFVVGAGQPFTYSTAVVTSPNVISSTALFNPPYITSGTVFTLVNIGQYEVNYQMNYPTDGGVVLYLGTTLPGMAALPYTMIGKSTDGSVCGSVIIQTTSANSFLSVNAAAGNSVGISIPPNSSTTNQSATTVSIKQIN